LNNGFERDVYYATDPHTPLKMSVTDIQLIVTFNGVKKPVISSIPVLKAELHVSAMIMYISGLQNCCDIYLQKMKCEAKLQLTSLFCQIKYRSEQFIK